MQSKQSIEVIYRISKAGIKIERDRSGAKRYLGYIEFEDIDGQLSLDAKFSESETDMEFVWDWLKKEMKQFETDRNQKASFK